MRMHVIRHVPFEGPALIAEWAAERGHTITESLGLTEEFPPAAEFDFLVVMGGPMAADDDAGNPWLVAEKRLVADALVGGQLVLGVCLGAQIVAEVAGGSVRRNDYREIGWFPVSLSAEAAEDHAFGDFPDGLVVGQWHGDTFDLPPGARHLASSAACRNQAFSLDEGRVLGIQFHLEWDAAALGELVAACSEELLDEGPFVISAPEMLSKAESYMVGTRSALWNLLEAMERIHTSAREA